MHEKKRNENRRDADRHEPFIADVTRRMKHQSLCRKFVVELSDQRFESRALEPQAKRGDAAFEKFLDRSVIPSRHLPCRARYH